MSVAQHLRRVWLTRGLTARLLWPLSRLYGALVAVRQQLYRRGLLRSQRLPVPVVVIGNVIAGGAGKTPVTLAVVRHLQTQGWRPAVVSRGYGRSRHTSGSEDKTPQTNGPQPLDCLEVTPSSSAALVGDEPVLIARATGVPVFVARRRANAARAALAAHPATNIIVCDDGLQHLSLARDVEICVFNDEGIGNGWLLPAGPLREPWPRAVNLIVHAAAQPPPAGGAAGHYRLVRTLAAQAVDAQGSLVPLAALRGQPLHAVAGIARPHEFFSMLRAQGLSLATTRALPDHHDFATWQRPPKQVGTLLCTEKDAVKLWPTYPHTLAVPLVLHIAPAFFTALDAHLATSLKGMLKP